VALESLSYSKEFMTFKVLQLRKQPILCLLVGAWSIVLVMWELLMPGLLNISMLFVDCRATEPIWDSELMFLETSLLRSALGNISLSKWFRMGSTAKASTILAIWSEVHVIFLGYDG
jgi:hypothetical protein